MLFRKEKLRIRTVLLIILFALCLNLCVSAAHRTILQQGIAQEILRFHVIANSDSEADQRVKYLVRDELLIWMEEQRQKEAVEEQNCAGKTERIKTQESTEKTERIRAQESTEKTERIKAQESTEKTERIEVQEDTGNKTYFEKRENAESFLSEHLSDLELVAERVLMENGMAYHAKAELEQVYFSERVYGEYTFPAGWYETLRIRLGEAKGQNWWCVLYPNLCFADCLKGVSGQNTGEEELREVLSVQEYESLLRRPDKWKITFRWF